jgi:hypothetical protein
VTEQQHGRVMGQQPRRIPGTAVSQPEPAPKNIRMEIPEKPDPLAMYGPDAQKWVCVTPEGPRTNCKPFRSDAHTYAQMVECPNCKSMSVRRWSPDDEEERMAAVAARQVTPPEIRKRYVV